ncbi:hypothetical protein GTR02_13420 [Kineococcus sp. R8]|uniref:four-carbon acid sugar kinase family protein n=1 Tax=Kineococcus siccus TaxID=2696567 RepID=UPI0014126C45|nr:four-carbon acid sugar kinase family protein [Kineococcus siccus]NAZ82818.1 hypothetical protein [Kineococcus siccus]
MAAPSDPPAGPAPVPLAQLLAGFGPPRAVDPGALAAAVARGRRLVVLDDDPTGTQSTTDLPVVTTAAAEDLRWGLQQPTPGFFVLTNSRSLGPADAAALLRDVVTTLLRVAAEEGVEVVVASRGDSTLRGHFPLETDVVTEALAAAGRRVDGVVVVPALVDAGRVTVGAVHLLRTPEGYVPVGHSEFARDATFGYASSDLREWVAEKTEGRVAREDVVALTLADLRSGPGRVVEVLDGLRDGRFLVADAADDEDLRALVEGLLTVEARGRELVYRTGPSFVRARTGQVATPPVTPEHLRAALADVPDERPRSASGLVVVGSHVGLTTRQLDALRAAGGIVEVELEVPTLVRPGERDAHVRASVERVVALLDAGGPDVVVRTSRTLVRGTDADDSLRIARAVSGALVEVVHDAVARTRPAFVLAKGGITSSDTATKALGITRAYSRGTLLPGLVSVWEPVVGPARGVAYVVFAGNVGDDRGVLDAVTTLRAAARPEGRPAG